MTKKAAPPRGAASSRRLFEEPAAGAHTFNIDGSSRGNPGPASYGVLVRDPAGAEIARLKKYIGRTTNNVAEYHGLIAALDYALAHGFRNIHVESDSELLVKQMLGQYKVKSADLRPRFERAKKMSQGFASFRIRHVYREQNRVADALANEALDETDAAAGTRPAAGETRGAETGSRRVRVRYAGGALHPLDPLALPEGSELEITLPPRREP